MASKLCPKCKLEHMIATGGGCNYYCPLCGYKMYEAPPRVHVSSGPTERMREAQREFDAAHRQAQQSIREVRQAGAEYSRAAKRAKQTRKQLREAEKRAKKEKKGVSLGTIVFAVIILWLLVQLLS